MAAAEHDAGGADRETELQAVGVCGARERAVQAVIDALDDLTEEDMPGQVKDFKLKWTRLRHVLRVLFLQFDPDLAQESGARARFLRKVPELVYSSEYVPVDPSLPFKSGSYRVPGEGYLWTSFVQEVALPGVDLLREHVPGFREVWYFFEIDLRLAVQPFWLYNRGHAKMLLENMHLIACLFAARKHPTLVRTALTTFNLLLHYTDCSPQGRPDVAVVIYRNCERLTEQLQEHLQAIQSVFQDHHQNVKPETSNRNNHNIAARTILRTNRKDDLSSESKARDTIIQREHKSVTVSPVMRATRETTGERVDSTLMAGAEGKFAFLSGKMRDEIPYGRELLRGQAGIITEFAKYLRDNALKYDPLYNSRRYKKTDIRRICVDYVLSNPGAGALPELSATIETHIVWLRAAGCQGYGFGLSN